MVTAKKLQKRGIRKTLTIISFCILSFAVIVLLAFNVFVKNSTSHYALLIKNLGKSFIHKKNESSTVKDIDGNVYRTVKIGTQVWMAEDLKTTHYNDGTSIPSVPDITKLANLKYGAYCRNYHSDIDESDKTVYGACYNWYALTDKLCPEGWHVSTYKDWETLVNYCGGWELAGGKLKEPGTTHWSPPNTGATNETGFTALPPDGRGETAGWWCPPRFGYFIGLGSDRTWVYLTECHDCSYNYVRCVKD